MFIGYTKKDSIRNGAWECTVGAEDLSLPLQLLLLHDELGINFSLVPLAALTLLILVHGLVCLCD